MLVSMPVVLLYRQQPLLISRRFYVMTKVKTPLLSLIKMMLKPLVLLSLTSWALERSPL